jgi:hypothetical protein
MKKIILAALILLSPNPGDQQGDPVAGIDIRDRDTVGETTVGMSRRIEEIVIPGTELVVKPLEDRHEPFVLRILNTYKHGTDHRYDLEFYGLEPGQYNLTDYLIRADGTSSRGIPDAWVYVTATLPAGQILPSQPESARLPRLGGYRMLLILGAIAWFAGLVALIFVGRQKKRASVEIESRPISMADRLRPLVQSAVGGTLDSQGQAELERTLIAYWCGRLDLHSVAPAKAMEVLRAHDTAGPLLRSLEDWLHRPDPPQNVDIEKLLEPYSNVVAEADAGELAGTRGDR